jgi:hypothetical protein
MREPVIFVWQGFVNTVVEVFVMGKNDMTANIVQLGLCQQGVSQRQIQAYKAFFRNVCRSQTAWCLI